MPPKLVPKLVHMEQNEGAVKTVPRPPPGKPKTIRESIPTRLPDGRWNTYNGQAPNARYNDLQQRILPGGEGGARFIPPDEYKEFLQLGHGGIFDLDLDNIDVAPWRRRGADSDAYFNYGFTERTWRSYINEIRRSRMELHLQNNIEIGFTENTSNDADLPPEVRRLLRQGNYSADTSSSLNAVAPNPPWRAEHESRVGTTVPPESMCRVQTDRDDDEPTSRSQGNLEAKKSQLTSLPTACIDSMTLDELQEEARSIQEEYHSLVATNKLSSSSNLNLQRRMLEIKKVIARHQM